MLTRCLHSDDERIAMAAAQTILDRGCGKPTQTIDANINEDGGPVRYHVEVPQVAATTEEWLESIRREELARSRPLATRAVAAVRDQQTHQAETASAMGAAKPLMMSPYFIALGSLSQRLPQQQPLQCLLQQKHASWVPSTPHASIRLGKVPVPKELCSGLRTSGAGAPSCHSSEGGPLPPLVHANRRGGTSTVAEGAVG